MWDELSTVPHLLHYVQAGTVRTRVMEAGSGPPMLLLHGTGGHLEAYARNLNPLAARYRAIAFDLVGHGWSTFATSDLELDVYVSHLVNLMDKMGLDRAVINGESLGGWVAIKMAVTYPERVAGLILNTPGGTMANPEVMEKIRNLSQAAADEPTEERIRARLEWLMADPSSVTPGLIQARRAIYSQPGFAESMRHILCLQKPEVRERNLVTDTELHAIQVPALVIWTSDDPSGPGSAGMHMADEIPRGEFALIRHAGHWPQWEQPNKFYSLVTEFLLRTCREFAASETVSNRAT